MKSLIVVVFCLTAVCTWAVKPNQASQEKPPSAKKEQPTPMTAFIDNRETASTPNKADESSPSFYASLKNPEWWLVLVGMATLIFVAFQAYETKLAVQGTADSVVAINRQAGIMENQVSEMREQRGVMQGQLDTMKGQLELEHRPWIAVNVEASSPISFNANGCFLTCKVTMTNVGHSVAKHVSLWTGFALLGIDDHMKIRDELCGIMHQPQNEKSDYGWLLFPGQSAIEHRPIIASPERIKQALDNKTFQGMNAIGLHLVGCVDYPSPMDRQKRHQTRFVYIVNFLDRTRGAPMGAFDPSQKTFQPIILLPTMHGASAD
jgi:hypothetical protein